MSTCIFVCIFFDSLTNIDNIAYNQNKSSKISTSKLSNQKYKITNFKNIELRKFKQVINTLNNFAFFIKKFLN